jgi:hypothetical protein
LNDDGTEKKDYDIREELNVKLVILNKVDRCDSEYGFTQ